MRSLNNLVEPLNLSWMLYIPLSASVFIPLCLSSLHIDLGFTISSEPRSDVRGGRIPCHFGMAFTNSLIVEHKCHNSVRFVASSKQVQRSSALCSYNSVFRAHHPRCSLLHCYRISTKHGFVIWSAPGVWFPRLGALAGSDCPSSGDSTPYLNCAHNFSADQFSALCCIDGNFAVCSESVSTYKQDHARRCCVVRHCNF